jgi:hypothetical protein
VLSTAVTADCMARANIIPARPMTARTTPATAQESTSPAYASWTSVPMPVTIRLAMVHSSHGKSARRLSRKVWRNVSLTRRTDCTSARWGRAPVSTATGSA